MSRSGTDTRKKNKSIKLFPEDHEKYKKLAQQKHERGNDMGEIAGYFMELHEKYNFYDPEWMDRVNESLDQVDSNRFKMRDEACSGLARIRDNWRCVKPIKTGGVKITLLGPTERDANNACNACTAGMNLEARWKAILAKDKHGFEEHTYCKDGGYFDDKTGRIKCVKQGVWQNQSVCFVFFKGGKCPSLKTLPARAVRKTGVKRR